MKTYSQKQNDIVRNWHLYDLKGKVLGRAATEIAQLLIGKNKPTFTPNMDGGDYVVTINTSELAVTGKKLDEKMYYRHSNFPGGFRQETFKEVMAKDPRKIIEHAVKGMLPKNKLQTPRLRRLKAYPGADHPHANHFEKQPAKKEEK